MVAFQPKPDTFGRQSLCVIMWLLAGELGQEREVTFQVEDLNTVDLKQPMCYKEWVLGSVKIQRLTIWFGCSTSELGSQWGLITMEMCNSDTLHCSDLSNSLQVHLHGVQNDIRFIDLSENKCPKCFLMCRAPHPAANLTWAVCQEASGSPFY